ncbi:MAG: glycosyltransferase family 39 protein, partial [Anaerolineales bacterium]|nr:glycosyltransferase family 39 protein [Anaerolineales bacterium]
MQRRFWWILVIGLTAVLLWLLPQGAMQQTAAFLLWWVLPALAWAQFGNGDTPRRGKIKDSANSSAFVRVRPRPIFREERPLTAVGLTFLLAVIAALLFHYLPGSMPRWGVLGLGVGLALLPVFWGNGSADNADQNGLARIKKKKIRENLPKSASSAHLFLLIGTALLRLVNLGYKEFQGDEGIILMRAAAALLGDDAELWLHQKGPVEILLPLLTWGSSGTITEFWARLPFLLANVAAITAVIALAHRWFGRRVALIAGLLLAINGFTIAFGRIIQYQSLVMLWGTLALLHADSYRRDGKQRDLLLVAAFLAGGLLAHYDAVLVVPAIIWLLWPRLWPLRQLDWAAWGKGVLVGAVCLGLFYVPFLLNPNFARTG